MKGVCGPEVDGECTVKAKVTESRGRTFCGTMPKISIDPRIEHIPNVDRPGDEHTQPGRPLHIDSGRESLAIFADRIGNVAVLLQAATVALGRLEPALPYIEVMKFRYIKNDRLAGLHLASEFVLIDPRTGHKDEITASVPFEWIDVAVPEPLHVEELMQAMMQEIRNHVAQLAEQRLASEETHKPFDTLFKASEV